MDRKMRNGKTYAAYSSSQTCRIDKSYVFSERIHEAISDFENGKDTSPTLLAAPGDDDVVPEIALSVTYGARCSSEESGHSADLPLVGSSEGDPAQARPAANETRPTESEHKRRAQWNSRKRKAERSDDEARKRISDRLQSLDVQVLKVDAQMPSVQNAREKWTGTRRFRDEWASARPQTLDELLKLPGFDPEVVRWDGSKPLVLVDSEGMIIGVMVGKSTDKAYIANAEAVVGILREAREEAEIPMSDCDHRRGEYAQLHRGVGGQGTPGNLSLGGEVRTSIAERVVNTPEVQTIRDFNRDCFEMFSPDMFKRYTHLQGALKKWNKSLNLNPKQSPFAASTFNAGEQVATIPHLDYINFGAGWCSITALGNFIPSIEGHLVLWDFGLVIEFPPATTAFIPSACVTHSNTAIISGRTRMSFTEYTGAVCFRFMANGRRTVAQFKAKFPDAKLDIAKQVKSALRMYLTLEKLQGLKDSLAEVGGI